jgi:hypothetical protein
LCAFGFHQALSSNPAFVSIATVLGSMGTLALQAKVSRAQEVAATAPAEAARVAVVLATDTFAQEAGAM